MGGRAAWMRSALGVAVVVGVVVGLSPGAALAAGPCPDGRDGAGWTLSTNQFSNLFTRHAYVGNGYLSQRVPASGMGYLATGEKTGWPLFTPRYDGAFVAGLYGADPAIESGRTIDAAIPTWSTLAPTVGSETFGPGTAAGQVSNYQQSLYLSCGLLRTSLTWTTADRRATDLVYDVVADRGSPHVGAVHMTMTPHWSGSTTVTDTIDGAGARRLVQKGGGGVPGSSSSIDVNFVTQTLGTAGTVASTLKPGSGVNPVKRTITPPRSQNLTSSDAVTFNVRSGKPYELTKFVGIDTALTSSSPEASAVNFSQKAANRDWSGIFPEHANAWSDLWKSDITVANQPELQNWIRSNLYALWSSIRAGDDNSISPVGLSSDGYAGLIFWDAETWMYPSLLLMHPDLAESIVQHRSKTLPGALRNAQKHGYQGTFYPWNGAGTGDLDQECHSWDPPHCLTQIHLQGDIALSVWQYYLASGNTDWLRSHWSILKGVADFWAGRVTANSDGSYSINNVAGPDEYSNGVNDGVFTNAGAATALRNATRAAQVLKETVPAQWTNIADHLRMPFDSTNQVFLQYDGFPLGGPANQIKQADTVLLIYPMEWPMPQTVAANTLDYYAAHTDPDGPAMTDAIHAVDSAQIGEPGCATNTYLNRSIKPFVRDPFAQFAEARGDKPGSQDPLAGAPAYDFLTGGGGFAQVFTYGLTGLRWRDGAVHLDPMLPPQLASGVTLEGLHWHGTTFDIRIGSNTTTVTAKGGDLPVEAPDGSHTVSSGGSLSLPTRRPDLTPTDDLARCKSATASSEEPGMYAEAGVDGSKATSWAPDPAGTGGDLTVDLGARRNVKGIDVQWTDTKPDSSSISTSLDGKSWSPAPPADANGQLHNTVQARYVRVSMTKPGGAKGIGIRELVVT